MIFNNLACYFWFWDAPLPFPIFLHLLWSENPEQPSVQSFALWQQATIEFTWWDHSIIACSRHIYGCCSSHTFRSWWTTHLIQRNASEQVATTSPPFTTNRIDRTFILLRLHLPRPLHPGHSTILLQSEKPEQQCVIHKASHCGSKQQ